MHRGVRTNTCTRKRHICSLLIKAREKTLPKYKVTQGRLDLPCWVLQAFKALFVQLGKRRVHRILCAEAANSRARSSSPMPPLLVPPFKHVTARRGPAGSLLLPPLPDVQKSIDQELHTTVLFEHNTPTSPLPCPASCRRPPGSWDVSWPRGRAARRLGASPRRSKVLLVKKCLQTVRLPYSTLLPHFPVRAQCRTPQEEKEFQIPPSSCAGQGSKGHTEQAWDNLHRNPDARRAHPADTQALVAGDTNAGCTKCLVLAECSED